MSQPQTVTAEAPQVAAVQQPAPTHERDATTAATTQETSPAPATDLPTNLNAHSMAPPTNEKGNQSAALPPVMIQGVTPLHMLSDSPQWIDCPFCQSRTTTVVDTEGTSMQILAGALCCLVCVCLTCVPCLAGWCEDTHFSCSNCRQRVATRPHDGPIQVFGPQGPIYPMVPSQYEPVAPPVAQNQGLPVYK
ncbi:uncharacterized protein CTRU02_206255 [Colletotrichum truncatum]|uniref:Uncharacterized protein n=1 Tax=Colletotrichum truncatum TaxID=5467 RepID=A0ACC3Z6M8_COLTU